MKNSWLIRIKSKQSLKFSQFCILALLSFNQYLARQTVSIPKAFIQSGKSNYVLENGKKRKEKKNFEKRKSRIFVWNV